MIDLELMQAELLRDEDMVLHVYDDATGRLIRPGSIIIGHPTIGVGRCLDEDGLTEGEALTLLANDIGLYVHQLGGFAWFRNLDAVRQRAIVNMRHQLGMNGLLEFHDMIAALERCDWTAAVAAGRASQWHVHSFARAERVLALIDPDSTPVSNNAGTPVAPGA